MGPSPEVLLFVFCGLQALLLIRGQPSPDRIRQTLTSHFSQPRHHVTKPLYKEAAREFIKSQFQSLGLTTVNHTFTTERKDVQGVNIIGVLEGAHFDTANDSVVAISAHYDTMRNTSGVNDNGAGVAVMLEAARELATKKPRTSTVLFIAFDFEEWESAEGAACTSATTLCGSRALVTDWLPPFLKKHTVPWLGLINMDTVLNFNERPDQQIVPVGFNNLFPAQYASIQSDERQGDFLVVVGRSPEDQQILKDFNSSWVLQGQPDFEIEVFPLPSEVREFVSDFSRSDHDVFWGANLKAVFLTDTANLRGYMENCYHQQCDDITHVTDERLQFAAKISGALISWVDRTAPCVGCDTSGTALLSASRLFTLVAALGLFATPR